MQTTHTDDDSFDSGWDSETESTATGMRRSSLGSRRASSSSLNINTDLNKETDMSLGAEGVGASGGPQLAASGSRKRRATFANVLDSELKAVSRGRG